LIYKIREKFSDFLDELEKSLEREAENFNIPKYLIKGKRLRGIISYISGNIHKVPRNISLKVAYALEMVHGASLIHDDIMDNAETRRGGNVLNRILPTSTAVIIGDLLFTKALREISEFPLFFRRLTNAVYEMALGQYIEDTVKISDEDTYLDVIYKKTATLYEVAFEAGALLSGFEDPILRDAGRMFGMAFQILDDCEDYVEDEGKPTLPHILENLGAKDPITLSKDKASFYLRGAEWNLERLGYLGEFWDLLEYMWERV
jgi:octaprenyl-diphosphate synthase